MKRTIFTLVALPLTNACSGQETKTDSNLGSDHSKSQADNSSGDGGAGTAESTCVFPGPSNSFFDLQSESERPVCPAGCITFTGYQLDTDANGACSRGAFLGCCAVGSGECGGSTQPYCMANESDGRIVSVWDGGVAPLLRTGWRYCTKGEQDRLLVRNCQ